MFYLKKNKTKILHYLAFDYMLFLNHFYYFEQAHVRSLSLCNHFVVKANFLSIFGSKS